MKITDELKQAYEKADAAQKAWLQACDAYTDAQKTGRNWTQLDVLGRAMTDAQQAYADATATLKIYVGHLLSAQPDTTNEPQLIKEYETTRE